MLHVHLLLAKIDLFGASDGGSADDSILGGDGLLLAVGAVFLLAVLGVGVGIAISNRRAGRAMRKARKRAQTLQDS